VMYSGRNWLATRPPVQPGAETVGAALRTVLHGGEMLDSVRPILTDLPRELPPIVLAHEPRRAPLLASRFLLGSAACKKLAFA